MNSIKKIATILLLVPALVQACPETIRYGDPCHGYLVPDIYGKSVYSVYQDNHDCTVPLLDDGVCPDYLNGGCALRGECSFSDVRNKAPVLFTDE